MTHPLKVVLAGCGGISNIWTDAAKAIEGVQIVGLVDLNPETARAYAERHKLAGIPSGTNLAAMIRKTKPDIVFDCTVPEAHKTVTMTALKRGCHVLGEKPMADTMANARKMVAAAAQAGKTYAVMQNYRYSQDIRRLRRLIESGAIGKIHTLHSDFFLGIHFGGFRDHMKHVLLLDMAIHTFDAVRFVSGADPLSVLCYEWNPPSSWYDHGASAVAMFEMTGGIVYSYRGSWCAEGFDTSWQASWRIIGDKGTILWDGGGGIQAAGVEPEVHGNTRKTFPIEVPPLSLAPEQQSHSGCLRDMIACIRTGHAPETVCTDNIKSLAMVHAAVESAEKGRWIKIAL